MSKMRKLSVTVLAVAIPAVALAVTGAFGAQSSDGGGAPRASTALHATAGDRVGAATFKEKHGDVIVRAEVRDLAPGFHGFHVHTTGQCEPPFTSAGGHFNPDGSNHGDHAGDLPTLLVNEDGTGSLQFETDRFSVAELVDADGSALIVHAGRDNYANIPDHYHSHTYDTFGPDQDTLATGDAGERAACGVVEPVGKGASED
jgi:Cu-Zn family superoxide dismutase